MSRTAYVAKEAYVRRVCKACRYNLYATPSHSPLLTAEESGVARALKGEPLPGGASRAMAAAYYRAAFACECAWCYELATGSDLDGDPACDAHRTATDGGAST